MAAVSHRFNTPQKIMATLVVVKHNFTYFLTFRLRGQKFIFIFKLIRKVCLSWPEQALPFVIDLFM